MAVTPAPAAAQNQARAHPAPQFPPRPAHDGARLRVERGAYHLFPRRGGAAKNGGGGVKERTPRMNTQGVFENRAWKPRRVSFVLFAGQLPLRNGEERGTEGSLRAESELRSQL